MVTTYGDIDTVIVSSGYGDIDTVIVSSDSSVTVCQAGFRVTYLLVRSQMFPWH